jgi:hypothetical protein
MNRLPLESPERKEILAFGSPWVERFFNVNHYENESTKMNLFISLILPGTV